MSSAQSISKPVGPWEDPVIVKRAGNQRDDIIKVQKLLTKAAVALKQPAVDPKGVDGGIAKPPKISNTLTAIGEFQKKFMAQPDRRVDVGGTTWKELLKYDDSKPLMGPPQLITYNGKTVPFYCQGDAQWKDQKMTTKKIGPKGCAITSIAMILAYYGRDITPASLDTYLDDNSGYSGNDVIWATAFKAGAVTGGVKFSNLQHHYTQNEFSAKLRTRIDNNLPTLGHVDYGNDSDSKGNHWVVIVGRTPGGNFIINDPGIGHGNGAGNPFQDDTILGQSTRKGGLTLVRLITFDVA